MSLIDLEIILLLLYTSVVCFIALRPIINWIANKKGKKLFFCFNETVNLVIIYLHERISYNVGLSILLYITNCKRLLLGSSWIKLQCILSSFRSIYFIIETRNKSAQKTLCYFPCSKPFKCHNKFNQLEWNFRIHHLLSQNYIPKINNSDNNNKSWLLFE